MTMTMSTSKNQLHSMDPVRIITGVSGNNTNECNRKRSRRTRQLRHLIFLTTTAFIWIVPWLFVQQSHAVNTSTTTTNDSLTHAELRKYLKIYNHGSTSIIPQSSTTPNPSQTKSNPLSSKLSSGSSSPSLLHPVYNFSTTTQKSSFVPTEVMPLSSTTMSSLASYLQQALPTPPPATPNVKDNTGDLFQSLNILNSLLGSNANTDDISSALLPTATTATQITSNTPNPSAESHELSLDESLQALSLLNSLLGSQATVNDPNSAAATNINLGSSNALLASLGLPQGSSSTVTRQANQLSLGDPLSSSLTNLLFSGGLGGALANNNNNGQNFLNFKNTGSPMDSASTTNQLTGLLGLLNTLGQFGGSSQGSSLFNFGQAPTAQPDYLSTLFGLGGGAGQSQQLQKTPSSASPNYLSLLFGGGPQQSPPQSPQQSQTPTTDFLATLLNGATPKQSPDNNLLGLGSLLGSSSNSLQSQISTANLLAGLLGASQQQSNPGLLSSLGTGIFSLAGNALNGLRGSNPEGKPRVRGMDTRVGLGYRFGPNADAQVMWELGPQLFTEPLTNEQREALTAMREKQAKRQIEVQQQQMSQLQQQLQHLQEQQENLKAATETETDAQHHRHLQAEPSNQYFVTSQEHRLRKTNKRNHPPLPSLTDILFSPPSTSAAFLPNMMHAPGPRPKHNGVSSFNQRPNAGAILPSPPAPINKNKRNNDPFSMLTAYEKYLVRNQKQPSSAPAIAKRTVGHPQRILNQQRRNNPPSLNLPFKTPVHHKTNQFIFSPFTTSSANHAVHGNSHHHNPNRIVRMKQINRRLMPQNRPQFTHKRMSNHGQRHVRQNPATNNAVSVNTEASNNFQRRMGEAADGPPMRQQFPRQTRNPFNQSPSRQNAHNNYQNFVPEAEDSFLKRNAVAQSPMIRHMELQNKRFAHQQQLNNQRRTIFGISEADGLMSSGSEMVSQIRPSVNSMFGMWNRLKASDNALTRLVLGDAAVTLSPEDKIPPDSLDTFNCYFCNGDYVPTDRPPLVAKPIPTSYRYNETSLNPNPQPSLMSQLSNTIINTFAGAGSNNEASESQQYPTKVHIGAPLTPEQLHQMYKNPSPENNITPSTRIRFQSSQMLNLIPTTVKPIITEPPIHAPGVEMFIDIDNGEISVRKNIGKLDGFEHHGDFKLPSTTLRPKTEEELDEEESQKIFAQVQEYLYNSYEEMKFNQELEKEVKKHKDKLSAGKDEVSHGMVSQYFNVLNKRTGEASKKTSQRRKRDLFAKIQK